MNLSTARSEKRAKEVGVRKVIGSRRRQLIIQFFSESILTVSFAFGLAAVTRPTRNPIINQVTAKNMGILWNNSTFWYCCGKHYPCNRIYLGMLSGNLSVRPLNL
jgi:hypothetical protein